VLINTVFAGANVDAATTSNETAVHLAVRRDAIGKLDLLINNGASLNISNVEGSTPLILAIGYGLVHLADKILSSGKDVAIDAIDKDGDTALGLATRQGYHNLANKIKNYGAMASLDGPGRVVHQVVQMGQGGPTAIHGGHSFAQNVQTGARIASLISNVSDMLGTASDE